MFFNKKDKNKNVSLENIASLLIHAAKIDENYSSKEEEIIKKSLIDLGADEKNLDSLLNDSNQKIDHIFFLNVNKETIVERIKKRKILEKRTDDDVETILKRYDTYIETTRPVLDYYSKNSNFHEIDGTMEIDQITNKIEAFLNV